MVDNPRDALECFGSAHGDVLALGPYLIRRHSLTARSAPAVVPATRPIHGARTGALDGAVA